MVGWKEAGCGFIQQMDRVVVVVMVAMSADVLNRMGWALAV